MRVRLRLRVRVKVGVRVWVRLRVRGLEGTRVATLKTQPLGHWSSARIAVPAWLADSSRHVPDLESAAR